MYNKFLNTCLKAKFCLEHQTEKTPKAQRTLLQKIVLNGLKWIVTYCLYIFLKGCRALGGCHVTPLRDTPEKPIVSLTSFPKRFPNLWMVLYGIFNQTVLPGKIVVTLTQEEVPGGFSSLPKSLQYFADKGVEYLFVDKNLRPHNKYFYTRQRYPERNIITVDDDLLYYPDTIERLMKLHYQFPKAICANKASKHSEQNRDYTVYNHWTCTWNEGPSIALMALGYGGVLYPPTFTHPHLYNCEEIKALALGADDLWLMVMEILSDTRVVVGDYYAHPLMLPTSQSVALQKTNTGVLCRNNTYLKLLEEKFLFSEHI